MKDIYIYIDGSDLEEISVPLTKELDNWVQREDLDIKVVNYKHERTPDLRPDDLADWDIGINIKGENTNNIEEIINYLHNLAVKYKRDFALGYYSRNTNESEDIAFFGYESGSPKLQEINQILCINC